MKKVLCIYVMAILVFGLSVAVYAKDAAPQYGGILKILRNVPPTDPIGDVPEMGPTGFNVVNFVAIEPLFAVTASGDLKPMLATGTELAPDKSYIDIILRKGVKFHDGTDFNAKACKWNLDNWIRERSGKKPQWKSVEIIDDYRVRLHLNYFANNLYGSFGAQAAFQVSPTAFEKKGREWCRWHPVGTGPFKFVKYERDVKVVFTKFDDYWQKGKPYLDGMEYVILSDPMTTQMAFQAGKLHEIELPGKQAADLAAMGFQHAVTNPSARAIHALIPSSANPKSPYSDKRVREAISRAINRKAICDALGYGWLDPIHQIAPSGSSAFIPEVEVPGYYNPEKAKELLKEAGYPNGFKTRLIVAPRWADREIKIAIQGDLAKVGVQMELEFPEAGKYAEIRWREGGWKDGLVFQEFANWPIYSQHLSFYWNRNPAQFYDMKWPEGLHDAVTKALETPQVEKAMMQKVNRMLVDDITLIPLYEKKRVAFFMDGVHDTQILTFGFFADWTPADAWLEKKAWIKE